MQITLTQDEIGAAIVEALINKNIPVNTENATVFLQHSSGNITASVAFDTEQEVTTGVTTAANEEAGNSAGLVQPTQTTDTASKPKRKRRTKAQIEADKAKEAAAAEAPQTEDETSTDDPPFDMTQTPAPEAEPTEESGLFGQPVEDNQAVEEVPQPAAEPVDEEQPLFGIKS